jgi:hypothetical protein
MLNRILIGLCFAILCISVPLTMKLQPRVVERTIERNIIVDSSVQGELEQKINGWLKSYAEREMEKITPQIEDYYQQKINALCKKREQELRTLLSQFRRQATLIFDSYVEQREKTRR